MRADDTVVEVNLLAMPLIDMSKKHLGRRIAPFLNLIRYRSSTILHTKRRKCNSLGRFW